MESLSFVVQGPIIYISERDKGVYSTKEVLVSIRTHYPDAEIILSTWQESDVANLTYDVLVLSADPGSYTHNGVLMNNNRLITSTKAGILKASNPYVVKTRTDLLINSSNLLNKLKLITPISSKYGAFNNYVLSTIYYVRNPLKLNLVFHPSDIFLIGTKDDLLSFFNVPTVPKEFFINADNSTKIVIEQYFFTHCILKNKNINYPIIKWGYTKLKYFFDSENYIFNSFLFFDTKELGVQFPKRLYTAFMQDANYTLDEAKTLSGLYRKAGLNSVKLIRCTKYLIIYYVPENIKVLWRRTIGRVINEIRF